MTAWRQLCNVNCQLGEQQLYFQMHRLRCRGLIVLQTHLSPKYITTNNKSSFKPRCECCTPPPHPTPPSLLLSLHPPHHCLFPNKASLPLLSPLSPYVELTHINRYMSHLPQRSLGNTHIVCTCTCIYVRVCLRVCVFILHVPHLTTCPPPSC